MGELKSELKQTRAFASLEQETHLNLQRTNGELAGPLLKLLKGRGLSPALYNILRILRGQSAGGLPCSQIGERMVTRDPDVTRLVDKLARMDLVRRDRSESDRRIVMITITPAGREILAGLDEPIDLVHRTCLGHLTRQEMKELNRLLVKARQPLQGRKK